MSLLVLDKITKSFGAIHALQGIDLNIDAGEAVGSDGRQRRRQVHPDEDHRRELSAARAARSGSRAEPVQLRPSPIDARRHGIEIVYQDLALCDNLTAGRQRVPRPRAEEAHRPGLRYLDYPRCTERAAELFAELKSETRPRDLVKQMSGGQRQAVAIARTRLSAIPNWC